MIIVTNRKGKTEIKKGKKGNNKTKANFDQFQRMR